MTLYQSFTRYLEKEKISLDKNQNTGSLILFKKEGLYFVFQSDEDFPRYFRLMLPKILNCDELNRANLYQRTLEISAEFKVGKLGVVDNYLWASFEQIILDTNADNSKIFEFGITILENMHKELKHMVESQQCENTNNDNNEQSSPVGGQ